MQYRTAIASLPSHLTGKKARFIAVGIFNTAVDFALFNTAILALGLKPWVANLLSTSITMVVSFLINKHAVFRDGEAANARQFWTFLAVTAVGLWGMQTAIVAAVDALLEPIAHQSLGWSALAVTLIVPNIAKALATVSNAIWNYFWYDRVVFAGAKVAAAPVEKAGPQAAFDVSIIVPAFNEADIIADTLQQLADYLQKHPELGTSEVIVVAAGTDDTPKIARQFANKFQALQVITPESVAGKGRDVRLGFQAARGSVQLFTDADLCTPLGYIAPMVERLHAGSDVVIGRRSLRHIHAGVLRTLLSLASNLLIRVLFLPRVGDSQCGFKGFRQAAAQHLFTDKLQINGWAFDVEVLMAARRKHYKVAELAIPKWRETRDEDLRNEGIKLAALRTLRDILKLRLRLWAASLQRHIHLLIVGAALSQGAIAWYIGMRQSVWFDEAYSITLIQYSAPRLVHFTSVDVHPPLYYLLLKGWSSLFGTTDVALRSFSITCMAFAIVIGLLLVKRLWDARTALFAIPFVIAAPFLTRYGFEIRMYALAGLICIGATYVLVAALEAGPKTHRRLLWVGYGLLVAAGMYTLYYTALVWIAHVLWLTYRARTNQPRVLWRQLYKQPWAKAYLLAIGLFAAWIPSFIGQLAGVQSYFWIGPVTYRSLVSVWSFTLSYLSDSQLTPWRSLIFLLGMIGVAYFVIKAFSLSTPTEKQKLMLLTLYATVPMVVLYCLSLPPLQPVFVPRYDSQAVISLYLLLGVAIATVLKHRRSVALYASSLGLLAVLVQGTITLNHTGNYNYEQGFQPEYRQAIAYMQAQAPSGTPVITGGPGDYMIYSHYLPHQDVFFYHKKSTGTTGGYAPLHNSAQRVYLTDSFAHRSVWIVYTGDKPSYIPAAHKYHSGMHFGKIKAYLYTWQPSTPPPVRTA